jgi:putative membrane protein
LLEKTYAEGSKVSHSTDRARTVATALLAVAMGGCAGNAAMASGPSGNRLTDPEIAAAMTTANRGEIEEGQLAMQRSSTASIRDLAQRIVTDHATSNEQMAALVRDAAIALKENDLSRSLLQDHQAAMDTLNSRTGADFDRAYLQRQAAAHRYVLSLIDNVFIPSAQGSEMKAQLTGDRTMVAAHLEMATQALAALGNAGK